MYYRVPYNTILYCTLQYNVVLYCNVFSRQLVRIDGAHTNKFCGEIETKFELVFIQNSVYCQCIEHFVLSSVAISNQSVAFKVHSRLQYRPTNKWENWWRIQTLFNGLL